jgi:hypothetical protein
MGLNHSSKIATNGLVFYYDQNNLKSYNGPAIQNLASLKVTSYGSPVVATGRVYSGGSQFMDIPQLGYTQVAFSNMQNNYTSFLPNSTDCCPRPILHGAFPVSPSTLHTYAIVYKCLSGYTHPNYMYRYEFTSNGGTYVTEAGVHDANKRIHLGDNWFWAWNTFTTQATTNYINSSGSFYYRYSPINDQIFVAKVLVTPGDYTSLHPMYWPEVNTTRSNTQALLDIVANNTITASSLSYANNGSFSFNGTDGGLTTSTAASSMGITTDFTISIFTKRAASPTNALQGQAGFGSGGSASIKNSGNYFADIYSATPTRYIVNITSSGSMTPYENVWVNLCVTVSGTSIKTYLNGVLAGSTTMDTTVKSFGSEVFGIANGYGYFRMQGEVGVASVYNRALTAEEIAQNFNALRGRYGI